LAKVQTLAAAYLAGAVADDVARVKAPEEETDGLLR
jgi:hypothetical protein